MTVLSNWTTATRPASPGVGETGLNTTLNCIETWDGSQWVGPANQALPASTAGGSMKWLPPAQFGNIPAGGTKGLYVNWTDITSGGANKGDIIELATVGSTIVGNKDRSADHSLWNMLAAAAFNGGATNAGLLGSLVALYMQGVRYGGASRPSTPITQSISSPSTTLKVLDTTQFQSNGGPVGPGPFSQIVVSINGHLYEVVGVSTTSGPGTLTFAEPIPVADGVSGMAVLGRNQPQIWGGISQVVNVGGEPSSVTDADVSHEFDHTTNNLDDAATRYLIQATVSARNDLQGNGVAGYPPEVAFALYLANVANGGSNRSHISLGGAYSNAGIDFRSTSIPDATITSATPGSPTTTLVVSTIMPFTNAGSSYKQVSPRNPLNVTVNGNPYQVIGAVFSAPDASNNVTAAGTLTFASPVSVADAAHGNTVSNPNRHAIWMPDGHRIALTAAGTEYLTHRNGGLEYHAGGQLVFRIPDTGSSTSGAGIAVAGITAVGANAILNASQAGRLILGTNTSPITVTLPSANAMTAGTGFTFSTAAATSGSGSPTILTPTSGGSITMTGGAVLTMDSAGDILSNGVVLAGSAGSAAATYISGVIYGQDAASHDWYSWDGTNWNLYGSSLPSGGGSSTNPQITLATVGSDTIDNGPVVLAPNTRYHVISDGIGSWHSIFHCNG